MQKIGKMIVTPTHAFAEAEVYAVAGWLLQGSGSTDNRNIVPERRFAFNKAMSLHVVPVELLFAHCFRSRKRQRGFNSLDRSPKVSIIRKFHSRILAHYWYRAVDQVGRYVCERPKYRISNIRQTKELEERRVSLLCLHTAAPWEPLGS